MEPIGHRCIGGTVGDRRLKTNEMNVLIVERIVEFRTGRDAASGAVGREMKNAEVRNIERVGFMIAHAAPGDGLAQNGSVGLKHCHLIFRVAPSVVGVVTKQKKYV